MFLCQQKQRFSAPMQIALGVQRKAKGGGFYSSTNYSKTPWRGGESEGGIPSPTGLRIWRSLRAPYVGSGFIWN